MSYQQEDALHSGSPQEMEIVEFLLQENLYGIQTDFVREVMQSGPVYPSRRTYPALEGICRLGDRQAPVLNLSRCFNSGGAKPLPQDLLIAASCKQMDMAFRANKLMGIFRIATQDFTAPGRREREAMGDTIVGVAHRGEERILILNLEHFTDALTAETALQY